MTNSPILKTAVEISKILGVSDQLRWCAERNRTITRWAVNGLIEKRGKGQYCLVSVFNHYRSLLLQQIGSLNEKIDLASNKHLSKSIQEQKMQQSIRIITANAKMKEHELQLLVKRLVNRKDADRVFAQGCQSFRELCMEMVNDVSQDVAKMDNPSEIQHHLEINIEQLLSKFSISA